MDLKSLDDVELLTSLVMGEAEGEPFLGKLAVAFTVKNRVEDRRWPDTWKGVMLQEYQFSCFLPAYFRPEILDHSWTSPWKECRFAAFGVYQGYVQDMTKGANHYHASYFSDTPPKWATRKKITLFMGNHIFYRL